MQKAKHKVYFIGAGPGDPELITVKAVNILKSAKFVLYTGSLIPKRVLEWVPSSSLIKSSENMNYEEIFKFFLNNINHADIVRLHTGDPSIYSTISTQIEFLRNSNIEYEVIPGVTAAFGAAASLKIEYTIPGISQTLIISRLPGNTPNPEDLKNILACKNSSIALYLSASLVKNLVAKALELNYSPHTPCWIIEKATWPEEKVIKGTLQTIEEEIIKAQIKKTALILIGDFLHQKSLQQSHLYNNI